MPRKVTKTMRAARKRAAEQRAKRRAYVQSISHKDFQWQGTESGRIVSSTQNKSNEPSVPGIDNDEPVFIPDITEVRKKFPRDGQRSSRPKSEKTVPRTHTVMSKEEYERREAEVQKEIERKKSCIAPAYNKGAYQYIGTVEEAKDVGRK